MKFLLFALITTVLPVASMPPNVAKCEVEPLEIFEEDEGYNSYDGITYASALEDWTRIFADSDPPQNEKIHYIMSSDGGKIQHVQRGKYIFVRVGAISAWAFGSPHGENEGSPAIRSLLHHVVQNDIFDSDKRTHNRLSASVVGGVEIPFYNRRKLNCKINGCNIRRCQDFLTFTDTFGPITLLDERYSFARSHGYFLLLPNDLKPGLYTIESERKLGHFLLPSDTGIDFRAESTTKICIGKHESCIEKKRHLRRQMEEEQDTVKVDMDGNTVHIFGT
mmetsp:Transcript_4806/g.6554  ORF Transcript_4806/g.6554 Transcript_4806/m.6554 type:complete len:278 (-) Transcript_4806:268-1101(-)